MNFTKNIRMSLIVLTAVAMVSTTVNAQTVVRAGEAVPFDGVLLTKEEAAKLLAEKEAQEKLCKANSDFEKEKVTSVCNLEKQTLQITVDTQKQKYEEIVALKDAENKRLYEQIEESTADYGAYWFAGGLALGALVAAGSSIAIFFAATQTNKAPSLIAE